MLDQVIRSLALDLIAGAVRHPDPAIRARLAEAFWDLQYLYRFGIPKISGIELLPRTFPPEPGPDPFPINRLKLHEDLIFDLARAVLNDPDPEPNITSVVGSKVARLAGARSLSKRLAAAQKLLAKEIERLEK
jgi:hypothetical protein